MKKFLVGSLVLLFVATFFVFLNHQASAVPVSFNQTAMVIPWVTQARNASVEDVFVESGYNGTITSWYHHTLGGGTFVKKLGTGLSSLTLSKVPLSFSHDIISNDSNIYYLGVSGVTVVLQHINALTGTETHDFTIQNTGLNTLCSAGGITDGEIFVSQKFVTAYCNDAGTSYKVNSQSGNSSLGAVGFSTISNMKINLSGTQGDKYISNSSSTIETSLTSNQCELTHIPDNKTNLIDNIACDISLPNHATKYWNGLKVTKVGNYYSNGTMQFFNSINSQTTLTRQILTLSGAELGLTSPIDLFILHANALNYVVALTSTTISYVNLNTISPFLSSSNRAVQSYMTVLPTTDSSYNIPKTPLQSIKLYGPSTNNTLSLFGMYSIISGYTVKGSTTENAIRTIDPQWTDDSFEYPTIGTGSTILFPIVLTVNNAPSDGAMEVQSQTCVISGVACEWSIVRMDSTHTAEFDILPNTCVNIFVADNSKFPFVYIYQGSVCSTGTNTKTIQYTNTLPLAFYSFKIGATSTFVPATNGLATTVRSSTAPFTYNVVIKNSTGAVTQNFTTTINGTLDTHNFNVTNATKPASLYISTPGTGLIYSAYLGSSLSLASTASFFHQYFNYQGFDLLSFIPIIFASMFTRNTVGIGGALTVVCIASLSWLSIVVIPDMYIGILVVISVISLIGYRGIYG